MNTCRELAELLHDFLSGELAPDHQQRLKQHLDGCTPCYHLLETYQLTIVLTRQLPKSEMPCDCERRLWAALARHAAQGQA